MEVVDVSATGLPRLTPVGAAGDVCVWTDPLLAASGIRVAFSERTGGTSRAPYHSLNLAAHVGDDPGNVDANRMRLCEALGMAEAHEFLVTAAQVHGVGIHEVRASDAGAGASASTGRPPIADTDALLSTCEGVPLLMLYADCVPVVIVATWPTRAVCVVHAGWRGALAGLPGKAVARLAEKAGCSPGELRAYLGPHIGECCYEVGETVASRALALGAEDCVVAMRLDLGRFVRRDLLLAGLDDSHIAEVGMCTRDHHERFFSFRHSSVTGRHGAIATIATR